MKNNKPFKVGDEIIDNGQACCIFKIKEEKTLNGKKKEKVIYYKPYFKSHKGNNLTCSIPIKNIDKAHIRRPISKKELEEILSGLSETLEMKDQVDTTQLRETLRLNDVHKTAQVLKTLWIDKNDESTNFTRRRQDIFSLAMKRLVEEVAFVSNASLKEARKKIEDALAKEKG